MFGYNWCVAQDARPGWYLVVTPEHEAYLTNVNSGLCECPDYWAKRERDPTYLCKHARYIRRETSWTPPMRQMMSAERVREVERDIAIDFA